MKKIILLVSSFIMLSAVVSMGQSAKLAFVEEFTQASCPPCEVSTPALNTILEANEDRVVQLRYQTSWPGVDPMNADNPGEVQTRVDYYGVTGVPTLYVDGQEPVGPAFPELVTQSNIDNASVDNNAPVKVEITHTVSADLTSAEITARIINEGTDVYESDAKLRVALVEELISWNTPPGSTSILDYEYVMKTFITGTEGMDIPMIMGGEAFEQTWTVDTPDRVYNYNSLAVVGFIQNDSDRSVVNAGVSHATPVDLPDVVSASNENVAAGLCEYEITPSVVVSNEGLQPVNGFTASYLLNGAVVQAIDVTETLEAGTEMTVDFDATLLGGGGNAVSYTVETSTADPSPLNNNTAANSYLKISATGEAVVEVGFEAEEIGANPSNSGVEGDFETLTFVVVNDAFIGANNPVGAFAESDQSTIVNFYQWNPANVDPNGSMTIADSWNIDSAVDSAFISFDHAFTTWDGSSDRLIVEVSNDCGATFSEVWNKAGSDLATAPELNQNQGFFIPTGDQWVSNKIDVSEYIGQVVVARFSVVSSWGDQLYIDNINTSTAIMSSNEDIEYLSNLNMFPNPTSDVTNVSFNLETAQDVNVSVLDFTGKVIMSDDYGRLNGTHSISLNTADLVDGVYLVNINFGTESVQRKLHVIK